MPHLIHCQISVVEIARASLEADFRHAIVNEEEVPQLNKKNRAIKSQTYSNTKKKHIHIPTTNNIENNCHIHTYERTSILTFRS